MNIRYPLYEGVYRILTMDITDTPYFEMSEVCIDYVDFEQLDEEEKKDLYRKEKLFRSMRKGESTGNCAGCTPRLSVGIWKNISATVILPAIRKKDFWN